MNVVVADPCRTCGARLLSTDRFCSGCGASVGAPGPQRPVVDPLLERIRGITLGLYDVHSELGRGGMAAVYLAHDLRLQRKVAIKVMLPALFMSEGMADRFLLEARTAARLSHPNIVVIFSVTNVDDIYYFVMGLVSGAPLDDILADNRALPVDEVRWVLSQAARALQHAHNEGVVHRDVKPANIMINVRGDAILTDFGIAKASESPHLTRTGFAVGTPTYMSPEQVTASEITGASDQYSLGILAYEMLAGHAPFRGSSIEVQWAHAHNAPPDLATAAPHVPADLASTVMRMLEKKPDHRWESLEPLVDIFAAGLSASGGVVRQSLAARAQSAQSKRTAGAATTPRSPLPALSKSFVPKTSAHSNASESKPEIINNSASRTHRVTLVSEPIDAGPVEAPQTIEVGQTVVLDLDPSLMSAGVSFVSSDATLLAVDQQGNVRALAAGSASISVVIAGEATIVEFIITDASRVATPLTISPGTVELEEGDHVTLVASAHDDGSGLVFPAPASVAWKCDNEIIATCSAAGVLTARARGKTVVQVAAQSITGVADVTVLPARVTRIAVEQPTLAIVAREKLPINVTAYDRRGNAVADAAFQFHSADGSVVTVDANGLLQALSPGRTTVRANHGELEASVDVTVSRAPVTSVRPGALAHSLEVGDSLQLTASAFDAVGVEVRDRPIAWRADAPEVARVTQSGFVEALAPGQATAEASCESAHAQVKLAVAAVPLREIVISPADVTAILGRTTKLTVVATDMRGRRVPADSVSWTSRNSAVCTVANGVLQARDVGVTVVMARVGVVTASANVRVSAPVAMSLNVTAGRKQLRVGATTALVASVHDVDGVVIENAAIEWASDTPQVATIDSAGHVRATRVGSVRFTATTGDIASSVTVRVLAPRKLPVTAMAVGGTLALVVAVAVYLSQGRQPSVSDVPPVARADSGKNVGAPAPSAKNANIVSVPVSTPQRTTAASPAFTRVNIRIDNAPAPSSLTVNAQQTFAIQAIASGTGMKDSALVVRSSRPDVVSIGADGKMIAKAPGRSDLSARAVGIAQVIAITVRAPVLNAIVNGRGVPAVSGASASASASGRGVPAVTGAAPPAADTTTSRVPIPPVVTAPVLPKVTESAAAARNELPAALTSKQFEALAAAWVAEQGQNLAARLTAGAKNADLGNRLRKLSAQKFDLEGGFTTRVLQHDGNAGQVVVSFPSLSSGGIPGTATITLDIKSNGRNVTLATLVGEPKFKNR